MSSDYFKLEYVEDQSSYVISFPEIPKGSAATSGISLRSIVRNFTSNPGIKGVPATVLYNVMGRLRSLLHYVDYYNQGIGSEEPYYLNYIQPFVLQLVSGFGFQVSRPDEKIFIPGLREFISAIENIFKNEISESRKNILQNIVTFESLQELFIPGTIVAGMTSCGVLSGFRVVHCFFEERRSLRGMEKSFHLQLEYLSTIGNHYALVTFEEVFAGWMGTRTRSISELPYFPASKNQLEIFKRRGGSYGNIVNIHHGHTFLSYEGGSFFMHAGSSNTKISSMSGSLISSGGRLVVDVTRGSTLGHYPTNGVDEPSNAMINLVGRYRRAMAHSADSGFGQNKNASLEGFFLFEKVPTHMEEITWPAVVGFSFTLKAWGHVLISGLKEIKFNDNAFDQLVLDAGRKQLIKALVRFGGGGSDHSRAGHLDDIIAGKSSGSIFLLHGPPGVGKTLTAEAISEVLHRPLYYVSMGELGTVPEAVENRLRDVLSLCEGWNALALIDEADVFLEKRQTSDFVRNAMVCVLLRLVEYHPGILFLTTNRVREFDPAFESRITVALKYDSLDHNARAQVWKTLVSRISTSIEVGTLDWSKLARHEFNGRQINNAIRLALALALDAKSSLTQEVIEKTIMIMETGKADMKAAEEF